MLRRLAAVSLLVASLGAADPAPYDAAALLAQAARQGLAGDLEWTTLLHVERGWHGVRRSLVDDPAFFLAPNGKYDPAAELDATLAALLSPPVPGLRHAFVRFPARCEFLIRRLRLDRSRLPVPVDEEFETAIRGLGPRSVAIAFPTAYMNTPASMFGHTLLVVRSRLATGMGSQAINYAALTGEDGGIAFALKGVVGGYPGHFSLMPYWKKLNEYSDVDQRDVWEYELSLADDEVRRLLLHVWEMRGISSDYFFFDENCAYYLLYLIDAARPALRLHEQVSDWVIPLDTVRILSRAGLVSEVNWRPSLASKVRARAATIGEERAERARRIAIGLDPPAAAGSTPAQAAEELELAADYLQSLRNRKKVDQADFQPRMVGLLQARSRIGVEVPAAISEPGDVPPDQGHGSLRLGVGGGIQASSLYTEATIRPAYHDLLDPPGGYVLGAQIDFTAVTLRWYDDERRPTIERFDAIGLRSFTPRDAFFSPPSWKVDTGLVRERVHRDGGAEHHAFVDFGVGGCWRLPHGGLIYTLVDADLRVVDIDPSLALGLGPEVGALVPIGSRFAIQPQARWSSFIGELRGDNWQFGLRARLTIHRDLAVTMEAWRKETWDFAYNQFGVRVLAYF